MTRQKRISDYDGFVEKFKPKRTTDDCFTPPEIYEVIKNYVCNRWSVDPERVVRPFWPGGDYQAFDYPGGAVVIDNPPFSILAKIIRFYLKEQIPFFLFCPSLTALSGGVEANRLICDCDIVYENGAVVLTSFVTSFGRPNVMESCPELTQLVNTKMAELRKAQKGELPKYTYPAELVTAAMLQRYAHYGVPFAVRAEECTLVRALDAQKAAGKGIYGAGLLLSREKTAERVAADQTAERVSRERAAERTAKGLQHVWELSERERDIVDVLSRNAQRPAGD